MNEQTKNGLDLFVKAYIKAALWSSVVIDDDGNYIGNLDDKYGPNDLSPEAQAIVAKECSDFIVMAWADLSIVVTHDDYDMSNAGHDFWLTRNGHGTGFWDRGLGNVGGKLTSFAQTFGTANWEADEDGKIVQF